MKRSARNIPASIRARLSALSIERREDFQLVLQRYAAERLLYRLGESRYRDRFVLKGAMLFVLWGQDAYRPTRDLDLLGYGPADPESIADCFREICTVPVPASRRSNAGGPRFRHRFRHRTCRRSLAIRRRPVSGAPTSIGTGGTVRRKISQPSGNPFGTSSSRFWRCYPRAGRSAQCGSQEGRGDDRPKSSERSRAAASICIPPTRTPTCRRFGRKLPKTTGSLEAPVFP